MSRKYICKTAGEGYGGEANGFNIRQAENVGLKPEEFDEKGECNPFGSGP